jgi:hypothetical protein
MTLHLFLLCFLVVNLTVLGLLALRPILALVVRVVESVR